MTKRKLLTGALALSMVAILAVGGTLAYFTDTEVEKNEFTVGDLNITLNEDFDEENAQLIPGKDINKDVTITVEAGSVDSYVWYTYAIPAVLDNDDASKNIVHVNHAGGNWDDYYANGSYEGEHDENRLWDVDYKVEKNAYTEDDITYNVYTTLYKTKISASEKDYETSIGMTNVYLDKKVDSDKEGNYYIDGKLIDYDFSKGVDIVVKAYGIQAEGFADVYEAYAAYQDEVVKVD